MGSRAALCDRRSQPIAERALYLQRNTHAGAHCNPFGDSDTYGNAGPHGDVDTYDNSAPNSDAYTHRIINSWSYGNTRLTGKYLDAPAGAGWRQRSYRWNDCDWDGGQESHYPR